jgi:predicted ATPase
VELATVTDPQALPGAIAGALGVGIGSGDPLAGLVEALRPLEVLVALDNAEQVVQGVANVVQAVLVKAPGVRFLVTTQAPLKLAAERAYRIGALAVPKGPLPVDQALEFGAVALFVERAQAADARFALTDANAPAIIDLCRQLDGVALAIELAAARAPLLGVQRLASSMGDRLKVLTSSRNRAAPVRQQTLRAALEWSHGFLEPAEQAVFRRMSVFAGSASLTLVQQVVADPPGEGEGGGDFDDWAVLDALALLVDRSLVVAITPDDATEPRYRLLDTPRLFAREKLQQAGEEATLRQRHAHAVAMLFEAADVERDAGRVRLDAWREALDADLDNGRAALAWAREAGDAERLVQIAALLIFLQVGRDGRESIELFAVLEPFLETVSNPMVASGLCALVYVTLGRSQPARALPLVRGLAAKTMALPGTDTEAARWWRHRALAVLSRAEARAINQPEAEAALEAARVLHDPAWPPIRRLAHLDAEAWLARLRGDAQADLQCTRHVLHLQRAAGSLQSGALGNLVDAELAAGDAAAAARTGREALALLAGSRNLQGLVLVRMNLAAALLALEDAAQARPHLSAGWAQAPLFESQPFFADYLSLLAALDGRTEAAARLIGYADAANARVGPREPNEAAAIARATQLARAALGHGEFDRLHAEGALLRDEQVEAIAFATQDDA